MNLLSIPLAPEGMPEDCPENSRNCERRQIMLDVGEEELHEAMEEWVDTRIFTASFSEGHIVDRTLLMQFPDDVTYENKCGGIEVQSESRIGGSDFGVNADRLDDLEDFLFRLRDCGNGNWRIEVRERHDGSLLSVRSTALRYQKAMSHPSH